MTALEIVGNIMYCLLWGAFCGIFLAREMKLPRWVWLTVAGAGGFFIPDLVKWTLGVA